MKCSYKVIEVYVLSLQHKVLETFLFGVTRVSVLIYLSHPGLREAAPLWLRYPAQGAPYPNPHPLPFSSDSVLSQCFGNKMAKILKEPWGFSGNNR